jgi:hypothetical protein
MGQESKDKLPRWLEEQQHQSWQIEILIASGIIFFLLKIPVFLGAYFQEIAASTAINSSMIILIVGGYIFSRALLIGFVVNLVLRAIWLAMLGINFAFPEGVDYKKLGYSEYFNDKVRKTTSLATRILHMEKWCSLSYSITILMTLMSIGLFILLALIFVGIRELIPILDVPVIGYIIIVIVFMIMLGILDILFFGLLKRYKRVSRWYYPVHRFFSLISLSFLYRKEWMTLLSNVSKWKVYLLFAVYFSLSFLIASNDISDFFNAPQLLRLNINDSRQFLGLDTWKRKFYNQRYDNLRQEGEKVFDMAIQSDVVKYRYLKLFVVYQYFFDDGLEMVFNEKGVKVDEEIIRLPLDEYLEQDSLIASSLDMYFSVKLNQEDMNNLDWSFYDHPETGEKGFVTYIDMKDMPSGKYFLELLVEVPRNGDLVTRRYREMPFVKE